VNCTQPAEVAILLSLGYPRCLPPIVEPRSSLIGVAGEVLQPARGACLKSSLSVDPNPLTGQTRMPQFSPGTNTRARKGFCLLQRIVSQSAQIAITVPIFASSAAIDYVLTVCDNANETCPIFANRRSIRISRT
jgi:hypothetical protein